METKQLIEHLREKTNLNFKEVDSSNIYLEAYHEHLGKLFLVFRSKHYDPGLIYAYKINPICYRAFLAAESKGIFFNENIRSYQVGKYQIIY